MSVQDIALLNRHAHDSLNCRRYESDPRVDSMYVCKSKTNYCIAKNGKDGLDSQNRRLHGLGKYDRDHKPHTSVACLFQDIVLLNRHAHDSLNCRRYDSVLAKQHVCMSKTNYC